MENIVGSTAEYIGLGEKNEEEIEVWMITDPERPPVPIWLGTIDDLDIWA